MTRKTKAILLAALLTLASGCGSSDSPDPGPAQSTGPPSDSDASPPTEPASPEDPVTAQPPIGIDIRNARMTSQSILVGGQPTLEQLAEAARTGYSTVVDLRPPGEHSDWDEATKATELGLRYINIPVAGADDLNAANAALLAEIVNDPASRPLMVHCASGNRVGGLFAMKALHIDGEDAASALQIGLDAGLTSLASAVEERLNQ